MEEEYRIKLNELHRTIIVAMYLSDKKRRLELDAAVELICKTNFDYIKLFKHSVTNRKKPSILSKFFSHIPDIVPVPTTPVPTTKEIDEAFLLLKAISLIREESKYITEKDSSGKERNKFSHYEYSLTERGTEAAKKVIDGKQLMLLSPVERRKKIFIACAFSHLDVDALCEKEFEQAINAQHFIPVRIDSSEPSTSITDAIIQNILDSRCAIVDLTYSRPSVYFEAGFAIGIGLPVIFTCRQDHFRGTTEDNKVHFDLEQYKISFWRMDENGDFLWHSKMSPSDRLAAIIDSH